MIIFCGFYSMKQGEPVLNASAARTHVHKKRPGSTNGFDHVTVYLDHLCDVVQAKLDLKITECNTARAALKGHSVTKRNRPDRISNT